MTEITGVGLEVDRRYATPAGKCHSVPLVGSKVSPEDCAKLTMDKLALVRKSPSLTTEKAVSKEFVSMAIRGGLMPLAKK